MIANVYKKAKKVYIFSREEVGKSRRAKTEQKISKNRGRAEKAFVCKAGKGRAAIGVRV